MSGPTVKRLGLIWKLARLNHDEGRTYYGGGKDRVSLDLALPVTWLGIGVGIGVPLGYWIAVTVWRYSHGWVSRWMDLREE